MASDVLYHAVIQKAVLKKSALDRLSLCLLPSSLVELLLLLLLLIEEDDRSGLDSSDSISKCK